MSLTRGGAPVLFALAIGFSPMVLAQNAPKPVPVLVEKVTQNDNTLMLEAIGTSKARRAVTLYSDSEGDILEFLAKEGAWVEKDAVVLRLDDTQAGLAVAYAQSKLKAAETALSRARKLNETRVRSDANVLDAEIEREQAKIALKQAQKHLQDHSVRAPFAGVLGIAEVEEGDRVTPAQALISLDDRSSLVVEFEIAERYYSHLKPQLPITAQTPAFPGREISGYIDKIDSRADPNSRTVLVQAILPNPADELLAGMSFMVRLVFDGPDYPAVPELALQWEDGKSYVWRIRDDKAEKVYVTSKRRLNAEILVEGEIAIGDLVVVEGVQRLRPGRAVTLPGGQGR